MITRSFATILLATASLTSAVPAFAQAATTDDAQAGGAFVASLADRAFAVLRDRSIGRDAAKARFRALLRDNFALDDIGNRLIRRARVNATPAQLQAYQAAFPNFVVNAYTDRLYDFTDAQVRVIRSVPRGSTGGVDVFTKIAQPKGNPFDAIWAVKKVNGRYLITNLTVNGVNLAVTQEADFTAYAQKNGFDALVRFVQNGGKA